VNRYSYSIEGDNSRMTVNPGVIFFSQVNKDKSLVAKLTPGRCATRRWS